MQRKGIISMEQANEFIKLYIPYYNRKFAVQAANPLKAYLPKEDISALHFIFAKHYTRKLDSGLSFSFEGQKYRLPFHADNKRISASPHETLTVASSKYIGVQILFNGSVIKPELLKTQLLDSKIQMHAQGNSTDIKETEAANYKKNKSPWFNYTKMFYTKNNRDDISAEQLST